MASKIIKVRVDSPDNFVADSFKTVWLSQVDGIQAVMGKNDRGREIQTLLFDKRKWTQAKLEGYLENRRISRVECLGHKKIRLSAKALLHANKPDLTKPELKLEELTKANFSKLNLAELASKYFFYNEFVHEGTNLNGDHFFRDELIANYQSASFNPINWEHMRDQLIGTSLEARVVDNGADPIAVGFNGVLFRLSDAMLVEGRDEVIRQRFFEGKLFTSMEVMFDAFECVHCGFQSDDFIEFDLHVMNVHFKETEEAGMIVRGLRGIDFVGVGIVEHPGDPEAEVLSLRTSDENLLETLGSIEEAMKEPEIDVSDKHKKKKKKKKKRKKRQYDDDGNAIDDDDEDDDEKNSDKTDKNSNNEPKTDDNNDKDDEPNVILSEKNIQGGTRMFKLADKIAKAKNLSDVFVIAQQALRDLKGEASLTEEQIDAFASELAEVTKSRISDADFKLDFETVYTVTDEEKLDAVTTAREEEKNKAKLKIDEIQAKLDSKETEITGLNTKISELETANTELKDADAKKEKEAKASKFVADLISEGVTLTDSMSKRVKTYALAALDTDESEKELKELRTDLFTTAKQTALEDGSRIMGEGTAGGSNNDKGDDLASKIKAIRKEHAKEE